MSNQTNLVSLTPEEAKRKAKREADAAKKAQAEVASSLDDAKTQLHEARLNVELFEVEVAGLALVEENPFWTQERLAAEIEARAAAARAGYVARFAVDTRGKAGWAAAKIAEARTNEERSKEVMKAEMRRAERLHEQRKAFFEEKILEWAKTQPPDKGTIGSLRCPEHKVRIQVQDAVVGGVTILDEQALAQELVQKLGPLVAMELGLVRQEWKLNKAEAENFVASNQPCDDPTKAVPGTVGQMTFQWATLEPIRQTKKLVIVRL